MSEAHTDDEEHEPWSDLTDELNALTDKVRVTYRRLADESGPTEEEIHQALGTLAGAWQQVAGSVTEAVADPEVRTHLKRAGSSFLSAVVAGLGELASSPKPGDEDGEEE
ncbi:hypothetical protein BH23ACT5_BH23ACT5_20250 [soil metagenome]